MKRLQIGVLLRRYLRHLVIGAAFLCLISYTALYYNGSQLSLLLRFSKEPDPCITVLQGGSQHVVVVEDSSTTVLQGGPQHVVVVEDSSTTVLQGGSQHVVVAEDASSAFGLSMESSRLIEAVRQQLRFPEQKLPYNLTKSGRKYFAQFGQDEFISKIFQNKRDGYFVEAGALDGEWLSNTLYFERELGWKGLLIEPTPESFDKLLSKNRKSVALNACLSPNTTAMELPFRRVAAGKDSLNKILLGVKGYKPNLRIMSIKTVPCYPFYSILQAVGNPIIDFFSLDVEGAEMMILKTIPWEKVNIRLLCIEVNHVPGGLNGVKLYLEKKGYTFYTRYGIDGYFYRADLADGMSLNK